MTRGTPADFEPWTRGLVLTTRARRMVSITDDFVVKQKLDDRDVIQKIFVLIVCIVLILIISQIFYLNKLTRRKVMEYQNGVEGLHHNIVNNINFTTSLPQTLSVSVTPYSHNFSVNNNTMKTSSSKNWYRHCDEKFRDSHIITVATNGGTGNLLFDLFCMLALSRDYCYTAIVSPLINHLRHVTNIFDLQNIMIDYINDTDFLNLTEEQNVGQEYNLRSLSRVLDTRRNWTQPGGRPNYTCFYQHETFIKSSITFKPTIMHDVRLFLHNERLNTYPVCCIHVLRTGVLKTEIGKISWYTSYINISMNYVRTKIPRVQFVFVSDDITWCKDNFKSGDVYFSPFKDAGRDLALLALSNHTIITKGAFGWMGAWLGNKEDNAIVVYRRKPSYFFPSKWTSFTNFSSVQLD